MAVEDRLGRVQTVDGRRETGINSHLYDGLNDLLLNEADIEPSRHMDFELRPHLSECC